MPGESISLQCGMMSRVAELFEEWTRGLDSTRSRITVFEHIRDIPYSLEPPMRGQATAPEQILRAGKGSCGPKHYLLAEMYRRLGLEVTFVVVPFRWSAQPFDYPPLLRELATALPLAHHLACKVRIRRRQVIVDATWDLPLHPAGFPVNETWDGLTDTECAVRPEPEDPPGTFSSGRGSRHPDPAVTDQFFREFDAWLWRIRTHGR